MLSDNIVLTTVIFNTKECSDEFSTVCACHQYGRKKWKLHSNPDKSDINTLWCGTKICGHKGMGEGRGSFVAMWNFCVLRLLSLESLFVYLYIQMWITVAKSKDFSYVCKSTMKLLQHSKQCKDWRKYPHFRRMTTFNSWWGVINI